jgi:mRNA interferase HicA
MQCAGSHMKISEFKRLLKSLGASFEEGTRHTKVYLNGRQTTLPRHATQDIGEALRHAILRQLGVKQKGK